MAGHSVVALVHRRTADFPEQVTTAEGDLLDPASLNALVGVDAMCHLAALTSTRASFEEPLRYFAVNVVGTLNLLRALAEQGGPAPRLVYLSTCAVYGEPAGRASEAAVPDPRTPYGQSKLAAEHLIAAQARAGALGAVVLRTFNAAGGVDGITDPDLTRIIPKAIAVAAGRVDALQINGDGSTVREFVHVDDLAVAIVRALGACAPGSCATYNVGSGVGTSLREIVAAVRAASGRPLPVEHRPPANEPQTLLADSSRIQHELGWRPASSKLQTIVSDAWREAIRT